VKNKLLLVHNIVAPYRTPLFEVLSETHDLTVLFCRKNTNERRWDNKLSNHIYNFVFLLNIKTGPFVLNPGLPFYLIMHQSEIYIIIDNEENIFSNLCVTLFAKIKRRPYVLWSGHIPIEGGTTQPMSFHNSFFHRWPFKSIFIKLSDVLLQYLYDNASTFLAYSPASETYLVSRGAKSNNIIVGTQAMSPILLPSVTKTIDLGNMNIQLLYLGYLRPEKGINILIQAMLQLSSKSNVELHIVGDGPEKDTILKQIEKVSNVHFHDYANTQERANWYSSVDVTILPTFYDPWGHTVTESLYYGTPVIVTSSAAASSVIRDGMNGFVFNAGNVGELVNILNNLSHIKIERMKKYIKSSNDPRLYDVRADAKNFNKAINMALKGENK
jgi:glycosyltransferase involved in cell wall biosynthesis